MKQGFILLEYLIYLACLSIFSLGLCSLFYTLHNTHKKISEQLITYVELMCIQSYVTQLLTHEQLYGWKKRAIHEIIWATKNGDRGISYSNNTIMTRSGHYNSTTEKWSGTKKHVLTKHVILELCNFTHNSLCCIVSKNNCRLEQCISYY